MSDSEKKTIEGTSNSNGAGSNNNRTLLLLAPGITSRHPLVYGSVEQWMAKIAEAKNNNEFLMVNDTRLTPSRLLFINPDYIAELEVFD